MTKREINEQEQKVLLEPHVYGSNLPKIRVIDTEKLMEAYDFWLEIPKDKYKIIKEVFDLMINSQMMLDDLQNNSVWIDKKGPTVQAAYGISLALNSANYATVVAGEKCVRLHNPKAVEIFVRTSIQFCRGQTAEALWKDEDTTPSEEEYRRKCILTEGAIWFQLPLELMQLFSDKEINLTKLTEILMEFFQIYEDYLNVCDTENLWTRNFLGGGLLNFPVVHALHTQSNNRLVDLLAKKINDKKAKEDLVAFLRKSGSLEYTKKTLLRLRNEAEEELKTFDENPYMLQFIEDVVNNLNNL